MNHSLAYARLIANAQKRKGVDGYCEKHHILPKALGGSDDSSNIVALTAREHFVAHMLLAYMHGGSMWFAVVCMKGKEERYINSRLYEKVRKEISLSQIGKKPTPELIARRTAHWSTDQNPAKTSEFRKYMSEKQSGEANSSKRLEVRAKISKTLTGRSLSAETKAKMSASRQGIQNMLGKTHSEATKQKMRDAHAKRRDAEKAARQVINVVSLKNHVVDDFATSFAQSETIIHSTF
jgi:hypothetical protein